MSTVPLLDVEAPAATTAAGPREAPHHRNLTCVKSYRCRRPECLARSADYHQTRRRLIAYNRWQPLTDAEPIRQHVNMLRTHGIGIARIRQLSGVSGSAMTKLIYGANGRIPSRQVATRTADRLLAVPASLDSVMPTALVDGTGTRRRLRALVVIGWPQRELSRRLGMDKKSVNEQVNATNLTAYGSTARAVRDLYNHLWDAEPATHGVGTRWIEEAKSLAAARCWAPPAAWDDDYIDSPAAVPDLGETVSRYAALSEDALWLMSEHGYTREQAAHRLRITSRHLERALSWAREEQAVTA